MSDGDEKQRLKNLNSLDLEASKNAKLIDLFGAGTANPPTATGAAAPGDEGGGPNDDERVEADMVSQVSLGLARLNFETCPKQSKKRFYSECDVT